MLKLSKLLPIIMVVAAFSITGCAGDKKNAAVKKTGARQTTKPAARQTSRRRSTRQNPIIKVLTSATFIRGVLGVLKKVLR